MPRLSFSTPGSLVTASATPSSPSTPEPLPCGDGWTLHRAGLAAGDAAAEASLFALANGRLGVRGGAEEGGGSGGCFLSAVYARTPIHYHERFPGFAAHTDTRLPVADATAIDIELGDVRVHANNVEQKRALDLRSGVLHRRCRYRTARGSVEVEAARIVPFAHAGLCCVRLRVRSLDYRGPLRLVSHLRADRSAPAQGDDPRIGAGAGHALHTGETWRQGEYCGLFQETADARVRLLCAQALRCEASITQLRNEDGFAHALTATLAPGQTVLLEKYIAYAYDDADAADGTNAALGAQATATLDAALAAGFDALCAQQAHTLAVLWANADLCIDDGRSHTADADPGADLALRLNLFHLWQSSGRDGLPTAAKGLTGEGYEGHHFWDSEVYVLPVLALTAPTLARDMLAYRWRTLERARLHARELNHERGALYAWRTISGDECSAYFPTGSAQYHINAAIAYAIRVYMAATDDLDFLRAQGAEMLFETARIWLEVGHFNARRGGAFCINAVTGPDEYSALVDNNYYTNRMARAHLRDAAAVWSRLEATDPAALAALAARIGLVASEVQQWRRAADAMYLPFDLSRGIIAQDDAFLDKPRWDIPGTDRSLFPLLLHFHPLTLYRHQVCKQADAVLALVLDGADVPAPVKQASYDYYAGVTVHDSTLSASAFSVLAAELGRGEDAVRHFHDCLRVDLDDLHANTAHGLHMASMAGSWHCLLFGFAGLRIDAGALHLAPRLPAQWRRYACTLHWRGRRLRIAVCSDGAELSLLAGAPLSLSLYGKNALLTPDLALRTPLPAAARWRLLDGPPVAGVIFDLDGVLTDTAQAHYLAWQQLADEIGVPFDRVRNRRLKGVDRMGSLRLLLEGSARQYSDDELERLCARKNDYYRERIEHFGPDDLLPGARALLQASRARGLRIALASASRNAPLLLQRLGIADAFDYIADPAKVAAGKPAPDIFLAAAAGLGLDPAVCVGVEDAAAGVEAIKAAGMRAIGIGDAHELARADAVLAGIHELRVETLPGLVAGETSATVPMHVGPPS